MVGVEGGALGRMALEDLQVPYYSRSYLCDGSRPAKLNSLLLMPIVVSFLLDCAKWTTDCVNKMWPCLLQSVPP